MLGSRPLTTLTLRVVYPPGPVVCVVRIVCVDAGFAPGYGLSRGGVAYVLYASNGVTKKGGTKLQFGDGENPIIIGMGFWSALGLAFHSAFLYPNEIKKKGKARNKKGAHQSLALGWRRCSLKEEGGNGGHFLQSIQSTEKTESYQRGRKQGKRVSICICMCRSL